MKILIVGISGAGKSTLARELSSALGICLHHLDAIFWKPGWKMPQTDEWIQKLNELVSEASWVIDGNFASSYSVLMPVSDMIVVMELPRHLALYRVLKRTLLTRLGLELRADLPIGCPEKLDTEFLKYIWNFTRDRHQLLNDAIREFGSDAKVFHLRTRADIKAFKAGLGVF
ncbi:MAG: topology modulation protein [Proteobacteria bacterium]|nr:MAG: topology modulation protein [Pseudomonadota bacterium]